MISVCLSTYNGEKYILEQIMSILNQLSENDEIIVSDNGSTDLTIELIKSINDKRIFIYKYTENKSLIKNIENALINSKGDLVFLADQDDVWLENKVEIMKNALEQNHLVISDCYVTDENLSIMHDSFFLINKSNKNKYYGLFRNSYLGCCMAFRRSVLNIALPFPKNIPMHDIWLGTIAAFKFNICFIDEKLIYYRRHKKNASTSSEPSKSNILEKFKYRYNTIVNLVIRISKF